MRALQRMDAITYVGTVAVVPRVYGLFRSRVIGSPHGTGQFEVEGQPKPRLLRTSHEGTVWIRGHHYDGSEAGKALLAAHALR